MLHNRENGALPVCTYHQQTSAQMLPGAEAINMLSFVIFPYISPEKLSFDTGVMFMSNSRLLGSLGRCGFLLWLTVIAILLVT